MRAILVTLFLFSVLPALAQTPDTTSAWRYFPLDVGNVWEYQSDGNVGAPSPDYRLTIEADTVIDGQTYVVAANDGVECSPCITRYLVRFDTAQGRMVVRTSEGEDIPWWYAPCELDSSFGADATCGEVGGGYEETVLLAEGVLNGVGYKTFDSGFRLRGYVAGVGFVAHVQQQGEVGETRLRYARIDGVEYGTPFPVASESAPVASGLALAFFPNPSRADVTAQLSLDRPQRVTLAVFDVLGRRVLACDLGIQTAGATDHRLDVGGLPVGVYVVRLDGDAGARATARIVRY